jgi:hypothetical protein
MQEVKRFFSYNEQGGDEELNLLVLLLVIDGVNDTKKIPSVK